MLGICQNADVEPAPVKPHSPGADSNASNDSDWERPNAEEGVRMWMPDYTANSCGRCHVKFSFYQRKHHCRYALPNSFSAISLQKLSWKAF